MFSPKCFIFSKTGSLTKCLIETLFKTIFDLDNIKKKDDNRDWRYRKLIIGPSGSGKSNYLLNSIQKDNNIIDKIYLYGKDLEEPKYQFLIDKIEKAGIKKLNDPSAFIEYSSTVDDIKH